MRKTSILLLLCVFSMTILKAQNWDAKMVLNIQSHNTPFLDKGMNFISNSAYFIVPALPVGLFTAGWANKDNDMWFGSVQMSIGLASSALLSLGLKEIIRRDRPFVSNYNIRNIGNEKGYSMPSSHTTFAFSLATSLTLAYPKWYVAAPSYLWAAGVAFSRMYLGVHYPTDIIVGILVGVTSAIIGYHLFPNKPGNNFLF